MKLTKSKKGVIENLGQMITGLVAIALVLTVGFLIFAEVGSQAATKDGSASLSACNSYACNGTKTVTSAMADIPGWLPIIVITIIGALLIGLVAMFRQ